MAETKHRAQGEPCLGHSAEDWETCSESRVTTLWTGFPAAFPQGTACPERWRLICADSGSVKHWKRRKNPAAAGYLCKFSTADGQYYYKNCRKRHK